MSSVGLLRRIAAVTSVIAFIQSVAVGQTELVGLVDFSQETTLLIEREGPVRIRYKAEFDGFDVTREYSVAPFRATQHLSDSYSLGQVYSTVEFDREARQIGTTLVQVVPREVARLSPEDQHQCLDMTSSGRGDQSAS
ncbi:MAG: hypothetical protein DWQ34_00620 [Planctomycetota bacterium]|nr:MAG: hypothetical protein DWQ34_00620 [Planctomycetota bacterium]REK25654.1 MAG: hypothetical protein DWQ41_12030 [Planctomycetota bacterium]REK31634.1 MAG: hypothetical protein DWQ45_18655 [Planctomycetota bacterium]